MTVKNSQWRNWLLVLTLASSSAVMLHPAAGQEVAGVPTGVQSQSRLTAPPLDKEKAMSMKIKGEFTLAAGGDLLDFHPVAKHTDSDVQSILKLVQNADVGAANMEANIVDKHHYDGPYSNHTGDKEVADDIKAMGFKIVGRASNHSTDEGINVMFEGNRLLEEAGIAYAGSGRDLDEAREAHFVEVGKGRVGMVAVYSSFNGAGSQAATYKWGNTNGLPGTDMLHLNAYHIVTQEDLDALRKMRDRAYQHRTEVSNPVPPIPANEPKDTLDFWGTLYKAGTVPGGMSYKMNAEDEREILRSIRNGKELSDFMIAMIHSHEDTNLLQMYSFSEQPADFLVKFAHDAIDNGADAFVGTGVHVLRSIEIYKGKPIFYGLASFVNELSTGAPALSEYISHGLNPYNTDYTGAELDYDFQADGYLRPADYDSVLAECRYQDGRLREVILHPIVQGYDLPQADRGLPRAAHGADAQRILEHLQNISKPFGTDISIEGELGVIHAGPDQQGMQ